MSTNVMDSLITLSFTWSALMFIWMFFNMVPRVETWDWRDTIQDVSVVSLVGVIAFLCSTVTIRRWFDLPQGVVAIGVTVMAIVSTPIAVRVHNEARGRW